MRIAFCGTGLMGRPMAIRLVEAGHDVTVWNRTAERADPVVERGAARAETPAEAASAGEVIVTMVADPEALEEVVTGPGGLMGGLSPGQTVVEMSTVGPEAVRRIRERLPAGVEMVDAPVLGSVPQATEGTLKVFVGGSDQAYQRLRPLLEVFGTPLHVGRLGAGAAMKLVVNATLPTIMSALGESLALADALGLEEAVVLDVLADSPIGVTVRSKRRMIESGAYPPNFKLSLALKDAELVTEAAGSAGLGLRVAGAAREWFRSAAAAGLGERDYSAVVAHIRGLAAR